MKILITGGAGFIGSHVAQALSKRRNTEVLVVDNLSTGKVTNLDGIKTKVRVCDIAFDRMLLFEIFDSFRPEVVIHLAATNSVQKSLDVPSIVIQNNVLSTTNVLDAMRTFGCRRIIFSSSSSIYGDAPREYGPDIGQHLVFGKPLSPYAASKQACESIIEAYAKAFEIKPIILRFFNVFGPRQADGHYSALIRKWSNPGPATIYGDGSAQRDFTHVSNVVEAITLAVKTHKTGTMDIGCGRPISVLQIAKLMKKKNIRFTVPRPGDIKDSCARLGPAKEILGYQPKTTTEAGIKDLLNANKRRS